ncbi:SGNH/GDSL hydrolase family protein [Povalibacter sp.]|uniref:SGNH/GDSL hydrolase family protein n=1 Tax=Povalibacter sp. TaxID=1962978 RepID=UPI002F40AB89
MSTTSHLVVVAVTAAIFTSACSDDGYESSVQTPSTSQGPTLSQVVAFGDSLSDAGTYNPTTADSNPANDSATGLTFSTKPGSTWAVYVAGTFGLSLTPNQQVNFGIVGNGGRIIELGGLNYAEGGARVEVDGANGGVVMQTIPGVGTVPVQLATARAIKTQIDDYLAGHNNAFGDDQLVLIQGGANDFFAFLGQVAADPTQAANAPTVITNTATAMVAQIGRLRSAGATRIVYSNLPDLGKTPQFRTTPLAGLATQLATAYNAAMVTQLNAWGVSIFDAAALINEVIASPASLGFTNATTPACNSYTTPGNPATLSALICSPATLVAPGADITYVFADGVHPTARAHAVWSDRVTAAFPSL